MQPSALSDFQGSSRYQVERELGQGGMGVVYRALDRERGVRVALKAITRTDALNIYRLKNEFRQLADISHPNLVSLHELVSEGDQWFFTMELVDGQTFDEYVTAPTPRPPTPPQRLDTVPGRIVRAVSSTLSQPAIGGDFQLPRITCEVKRLRHVLRQLVEAIAALHSADKLHRDIKPSNVLVTPEGRVVVLDFGLVSDGTFVDPDANDAERTVGGSVFGTPAYMSPEQAAGEPVTTASDWYSLGAMLYEALTGQLPFDGSVLEILRQKEESEPIPPSELVSGVPDDLDQLCRALLRRQAHERPTGPEILRYLTGNSTPPPAFNATSSMRVRRDGELFVGRERHMAQLGEAFDDVDIGRPVVAMVHGISGMGKSALVRCFANELIKHEKAVVLRGRCYERESVPYKAFDNVIDALSRYLMQLPHEEAAELLPRNIHSLAKLFPVLRRVRCVAHARLPKHQTRDARALRDQAFEALKDLLLRISDYQPLVIQIDDLQWGDADSARLLLHVLGSPKAPPILFVGAYRRDEIDNSPFLRHVLGVEGFGNGGVDVRDVPVDALGHKEAEHLARELLRDYPTANALFAHTIAAEAEGVPFFITELVEHTRTSSHVVPMSIGGISLEEVIMARIGRMPVEAQRLLQVLSVTAGPIEQAVAIEAASLDPGERKAILSLRAARLIRTRGTRQNDLAETYHDRVRETVVSRISADAIRDYHARLAEAIERLGVGDAERLVEHYTGAGNGVRAGETAVQAARAATDKLAFNRAVQLYRKALQLVPRTLKTMPTLLREYGDALSNSGRGGEAADVYLDAAGRVEGPERQALRRMAAQQLLRSGHWEDARELVSSLLREANLSLPRSNAHAALGWLRHRTQLALTGRNIRLRPESEIPAAQLERIDAIGCMFREISLTLPFHGASMQAQYLRLALAAGEPNRILKGLTWNCISEAMAGGSNCEKRIAPHLEQIVALADQLDHPEAHGSALAAVTVAHLVTGRYTQALVTARECEAMFQRAKGTHWEASVAAWYRFLALELTGDLSEMIDASAALTRVAAERDDRFTPSLLAIAQGNAHLANDDPEACARCTDAQSAILGAQFTVLHHMTMHRKVESFLYRDDGEAAYAYLHNMMPAIKASHVMLGRMSNASVHYLLARVAFAKWRRTGEARLLRDVKRCNKVAHEFGSAIGGFALALRGTVAASVGDVEGAINNLRLATDQFRQDPESRGLLCAERHLGVLIGGSEGEALVKRSDAALSRQGIVRPDRWTAMHIGALPE